MADEKKKDALTSFLPLLLIPVILGAFTGITYYKDVFTTHENEFKTLIQNNELNYSSQELETIQTNLTTLDIPKVLELYVYNETNDTVILKSNSSDLEFEYNKTLDKLLLKENFHIYSSYATTCGIDLSVEGEFKKCHLLEVKVSCPAGTETKLNDIICGNYSWSGNGAVAGGCTDGCKVYIYLDGEKVVTTSFNSATNKEVSKAYNISFLKGVRVDTAEEQILLKSPGELIIVTANPNIINETTLNYKLVSEWNDNLQYAIEDLQYKEDFINAINRYFKPAKSYTLKFGNDTWEFEKKEGKNVMALLENAKFTLTPNDRIISILTTKQADIKIDNRTIYIYPSQDIDLWVKLEPYNATFTGKIYFYGYSVLDRIIGFFKSLLRFDLADAVAYATGEKEYTNETTITAIEPEYINLLTKLNGEITVSDSQTPADIKYADNSFSSLFAVRYTNPICIFTSSGKAICGKVFIVASQNNIVYLMSTE